MNVNSRLATLALSTATTTVIVLPGALDVQVHLGSLSLSDDSPQQTSLPEFKHLLSIEGDSLAEVRYQTFDPSEVERRHGVKSAVELTAGSLKLHYLERPLHDLYVFLSKLAKLKGLYDSATQVAVQRASEIEKMQLKLNISTPIIVLPTDPSTSQDVLTMQLGAISLDRSYTDTESKMDASLRGLKLTSALASTGGPSTLKMIDDIEIVAKVVAPLVPSEDPARPDSQVCWKVTTRQPIPTQAAQGFRHDIGRQAVLDRAPVPDDLGHLALRSAHPGGCTDGRCPGR